MSTYILPLLAASVAAAAAELLAPKGDGGRLAAHIRMVAGLFLLAALLNPLRVGLEILRDAADGGLADRLAQTFPAVGESDGSDAFSSMLTSMGQREVEGWVTDTLDGRFGIPATACAVEAVCDYGEGTVSLVEVRIGLKGKYALENPHPIEDYFARALACPCYVTAVGE
jgi:hypothetical protein